MRQCIYSLSKCNSSEKKLYFLVLFCFVCFLFCFCLFVCFFLFKDKVNSKKNCFERKLALKRTLFTLLIHGQLVYQGLPPVASVHVCH